MNVIDVRDLATAAVNALDTERYGEPIYSTAITSRPTSFSRGFAKSAGAPSTTLPRSSLAYSASRLYRRSDTRLRRPIDTITVTSPDTNRAA